MKQKKDILSGKLIRFSGLFLFAIVLLSGTTEAKTGESNFKYVGYITGKVTKGTADFYYMKRIDIWNLTLGRYDKSSRESYYARIFFSRDFTPKVGEFPIKFSYLTKKDTCGGSFIFREKNGNKGSFSHDTKGTITFREFSNTVKGTFSMKVKDGEGKTVDIKGDFELERGEAFKEQN